VSSVRIALEVEARVVEQRGVAREVALGLRELHLERHGVDLRDRVPGLDELALLEIDARQHAVDARGER
jgi:hypothetical protein